MPSEFTFESLRLRSVVDEETGCWVFQGGRTKPQLWFPPLQARANLAQAISWLKSGGQKAPKGVHYWPTCRDFRCCNPEHRRKGTRSDYMRVAIVSRPPEQRAQIARTKRAASVVSDEQCEEIRRSKEPLRVLSARYGISISHASRIRMGELRKPLVSGASVFSWRPNT